LGHDFVPLGSSRNECTGNHGFFRSPFGAFADIDCPSADNTAALGINDAEQIVGEYSDASGTPHGFC
jgi:hypothetical protein